MSTLTQATLVIFKSPNGRDQWVMVEPKDVPEWLKKPDVMAQLVTGEMAMKADEDEPDWFRAEVAPH